MKEKKHRVNVSQDVFKIINNVKDKLKARSAKVRDDVTEEIIDIVFKQPGTAKMLEQFIEDKTPLTFQMETLSSNDEFNEQLRKLIKSHSKKQQANPSQPEAN